MSTTLVTDARNRALRTFVQGVGIDVLVAIAAVLLVWLPDADVSNKEAWLVLGTSVVKSVLTAIAAYVMRAKLDGSGLSPAPPADPGPNTSEAGAVDLMTICVVLLTFYGTCWFLFEFLSLGAGR